MRDRVTPATILRAIDATSHATARPAHPFLDWPGPLAFAHRGGAGEAPENTLPAFERAIGLGYTYLETDVHVTTDGVVVAFHDDDLLRTCGRPGRISALPWSEVAAARVDGREPIPRLDELLAAWPHARFNIDCKTGAAAMPLATVLERAAALARVCVSSFDDRRTAGLRRRLGRGLCTSTGPAELAALRFAGVRATAALIAQVPVRHRFITVVTPAFVRRAHRRGLQVHVWTIDDPDEMRRLLDMGVDGIMTDRPGVLREVLIERGAWTGPASTT